MSAASLLRVRLGARVGTLALDVDFEVGEGSLVIVGPNGAGKTSLLGLLLGVLPAEQGRVELAGGVLFDGAAGVEVPVEARRIGYVPQDFALFPHLTVRGNVDFALASGPSPAPRERRATAVLRDLGLEAVADRRPATLSGGEKQRAALARALSVEPRALLLDEPLAALDVHARREVRAFLAGYLRALSVPTIVVTHDPDDARLLGARVAVLEAGKIVQLGTWSELASRPATAFVAELTADGPNAMTP
jgi:molybdate transport system ATP-binding protein